MDIKETVHHLEVLRRRNIIGLNVDNCLNHAIKVLQRIDKAKIAAVIHDALGIDDDGMYLMGSAGKDFLAGEIVSYLKEE